MENNFVAKTSKANSGRIYKISSTQPFSKGGNRLAFKAKITQGSCKNQSGVVKVFIEKKKRNNVDAIKYDIRSSQIAKKYAIYFCDKLGDAKKLTVRGSQKAKIEKIYKNSDYFSVGDIVVLERFIKPKFQKWTSWLGDQYESSKTLNAFQHFVYVKSEGKRMICDLQGGKEGGNYILTDPCVYSTMEHDGGKYANGAQKTIKKVMARHKCNQLCQKLKLPKH